MGEVIEMANGWTVLDAADLRLAQSEPVTDNFLRYPILAVERNVVRVLAVGSRNQADVLQSRSIAELLRFPKIVRYAWRFDAQDSEPLLTGAAQLAGVVTREARPTPAVARPTAPVHWVLT
ncbi:MAG: hypothetical protein M3R63_09320 [Actinomycetota bacterium]|nr:hypothetical protein [Actinomycetota bacterium]